MTLEAILTEIWRYMGLWLSALIFLAPLRKREGHCVLRAVLAIAAGTGLRLAAELLAGLVGGTEWIEPVVSYMVVLLLFWQCADITPKGILYCGIWVVMVHNLSTELSIMLYRVLEQRIPLVWMAGMAFWCGSILITGATVARWMPDKRSYRTGPRQLTLAFLLWGLALGITWLYRVSGLWADPWSGWVVMILIKVYCLTVLYLQHELFQKSAIRQELTMLNRLWLQQKNQYDLAKENIALINRKCHDLKHQIKAMRLMFADKNREKYLREVEQSVRIYEVLAKTGNEVLDTVLTEKSLYCEANGIQANCVADGSLLEFMDPVDLYTIFGNAMDNAIESVKSSEDRSRRIIDVRIYAEKQMLVIQVMNPVNQELRFDEDGLPISTKERDGYHGFGLRSIRHTVKKYGGFLSVKVEDGIFYLQILLPATAENDGE